MFSFYHIINFGNLTVHSYRQFSYCHLKSERQERRQYHRYFYLFLRIPGWDLWRQEAAVETGRQTDEPNNGASS